MRIQLMGVSAALALAVALTGCSSSGTNAAVGVGGGAAASSAAPGGSVASAEQLQAALLTASDLGASFTVQPSDTSSPGDTTQPTGCSQLTELMNRGRATPTPSGASEAQVVMAGGQTGPFVGEFLTSAPSAQFDRKYPQVVGALKSCQELNLPTGTDQIHFKLSTVDFGTPGSVAKRMDGTVQGVPVNGYLAVDRLSPTVAMVYLFIQIANESPRTATAFYHQAVNKADVSLGVTAPSAAA